MSLLNIFVPTIQNTGTWFLIDTLRKHPAHMDICEIGFLEHLGRDVIHPDMGTKQSFGKNHKIVFQSHICEHTIVQNTLSNRLFLALCCSTRMVFPVRDPMKSIITMREKARHHKIPDTLTIEQREELRVKLWVGTIKMLQEMENICDVFYFPVETEGLEERKNLLKEFFIHCRIIAYPFYIKERAEEWPVVGSRGRYEEKKLYDDGDIKYFEKAMPVGLHLLRKSEPLLRPFLERFNYNNLIWWTK